MAIEYEPVTPMLLRAMIEEIVRAVQPLRVILFGSYARGEARPDSDLDLIVEEEQPFGPGRSRADEAGRLAQVLARFFVPKDILVFSRDEVSRRKGSRNHVIGHALREGRVIYERS